jgi:hypothetical protein
VCGASGTGKTSLCSTFTIEHTPFIPLEGDILWCPAFNNPDDNYRDFNETWLRMAKNIGQSGYPVMLFSAGAGVPGNIYNCTERRYFADIHTMALVCDSTILAQRLQNRPKWRNCSQDFIQHQLAFNRWYIEVGITLDPPIELLDTSKLSIQESAAVLSKWIHRHLPDY